MPENNQKELLAALLSGVLPNGVLAKMLSGDEKIYNPVVDRTGDKILIPEGAHLPDVISSLQRQHEREEQRTRIHVTIPVSPWDGALALVHAIEQNLGVVIQQGSAHQIDVEVELGKTIQVPWGEFELPGMEGAEVETDFDLDSGRVVFQCHVTCKRKYEDRVRRLLDTVRERAMKESLHRGKAFSIVFKDKDGREIKMPKPKFFEYSGEQPVFRAELAAAIERNVFVPIRHSNELREMGETLKRGILFAGEYGVGKTLLASNIANVATAEGWTFIYVKDSEELPEALRYAQQYQPVVVFAEDVDRVAGSKRTDEVNELLNQLDGIDSKTAQIFTILTSNHPDQINEAMRRPGRIDMVLEVLSPDEDTVSRMIRQFSKGNLDPEADLTEVSGILAGEAPARVRETIGRAKLEALRRTGKANAKINGDDLAAVAKEVKAESALFRKPNEAAKPAAKELADGLLAASNAMHKVLGNGHAVGA
ncbi:MAG: ATP-binding protein [Candidatus Moranbacteria bacterium]|nr:ATP-binding protein [Candidatus Moranbacteria bacterium]